MEKVSREAYHEYLEKRLNSLAEIVENTLNVDRAFEATNRIDWIMRELYYLDDVPSCSGCEEEFTPVPKEELFGDFSTKELIQELERRGVLKIRKTEEEHLYTVVGNFYDN